jgi:hypothetical protein
VPAVFPKFALQLLGVAQPLFVIVSTLVAAIEDEIFILNVYAVPDVTPVFKVALATLDKGGLPADI